MATEGTRPGAGGAAGEQSGRSVLDRLRPRKALAVVAHPDDESFGLGGLVAALVDAGTRVDVLCLTHGEASTLGEGEVDLGEARSRELRQAADCLGVDQVALLAYPDGALSATGGAEIDGEIESRLDGADVLIAFEPGGVTGHPDHRAASAAATRVAARHRLATIEWGVAAEVASTLNREFGTTFTTLDDGDDGVVSLEVDRRRQMEAIACHRSQSHDNPVLRRRLDLQGDRDLIRWRPAPSRSGAPR